MPVQLAVVKEIGDRLGKLKDAAADAIIRAGELKLWAGEGKKQLEKAKEDDVAKVLAKALENMNNNHESLLKEAKAAESHYKALAKLLAEARK